MQRSWQLPEAAALGVPQQPILMERNKRKAVQRPDGPQTQNGLQKRGTEARDLTKGTREQWPSSYKLEM